VATCGHGGKPGNCDLCKQENITTHQNAKTSSKREGANTQNAANKRGKPGGNQHTVKRKK
jgi:hypothetical protein